MRDSLLLAVLFCILGDPGTASAEPPRNERYYITLFGAQSVPFQVRYTHTWATFIRTTIDSSGEHPIEVQTISWLPATLQIHPLSLRREPGVNLSLSETLAWVNSFHGRVSVWGPYEITADRYFRYLARKADLESGEVAYRAIGSLDKDPTVSNCGQSFARASRTLTSRYEQPTPVPGERGTSGLVKRYIAAGLLINPEITHDWLLPFIGTDQYPMTQRQPTDRVRLFGRARKW